MSKRCCAKNCYNSVLYNKSIAYFSFPKNKKFAQQWAALAGRRDLMEKPINRLVKYYLCSEHFTANCFIDKGSRQTLKRNLPHFIALPTIFKNNLQETIQHVNPRSSIEVHNIVLLDIDEQNSRDDLSSKSNAENLSPSKSDVFEYDKSKYDCMDICTEVSNNNGYSEGVNSFSTIYESPMHCRLCFSELNEADCKVNIKDSLHLKEFIARIMAERISTADHLSQIVCKDCERKALLCIIIVQQMDKAQEKMLRKNVSL